jgi:phosphoribosylanthranilate isomerase
VFVKICGVTTPEDAAHAATAGASAVGVVFAPGSPRCVTADTARAIVAAVPVDVPVVGVFVDETLPSIVATVAHTGIRVVQLHGTEVEHEMAVLKVPVFKAVGVDGLDVGAWPAATLLLDAVSGPQRGGTGVRVDWTSAGSIARQRRVVLAGGLTAENVAEAIATVHPYGVDVSSGVESRPGAKDRDTVERFIRSARQAFSVGV